jgi:predicted phage tail protein
MTTERRAVDGKQDLDALRAEIRLTRAELGQTVEALAAKADVKARMKESAEQTRERMRESAGHAVERVRGAGPVPWIAIAAGTAALVVVFLVIRRRRS